VSIVVVTERRCTGVELDVAEGAVAQPARRGNEHWDGTE
jgi:hypothetical protein